MYKQVHMPGTHCKLFILGRKIRAGKIVNEERQRQTNRQEPYGKVRWKQIVVKKVLSRSKTRMEETFSVSGREHKAGAEYYNGMTTSGAGRAIINEEQRERLDDEVQVEARKHLGF